MLYKRMAIEKESPEETGYNTIQYNLAESSVTDLRFKDLQVNLEEVSLEYIPHRGHTALRQLLVEAAGLQHEQQALLTNGAAGALFIVNTSLLTATDHLIVIHPNYATNIEVPLAIGCAITFIRLRFEDNWRIPIADIQKAVRPNTRLISITTPHNPTGMLMTEAELLAITAIAEENDTWLLADETYRDTCFATPYPVLASRSKKIITVSSLSKAYGLPGLRIGWILTQQEELMEQFLAAKEMMYISNSAIDEICAYEFYKKKDRFANAINQRARHNFELLKAWLQQEHRLEAVLPEGGVVCFPRFVQGLSINTTAFYQMLQNKYRTMVGPGHWFDMPDTYMRIGFGWTDALSFQQGLNNISLAINECLG